jgi:hypothetical protein
MAPRRPVKNANVGQRRQALLTSQSSNMSEKSSQPKLPSSSPRRLRSSASPGAPPSSPPQHVPYNSPEDMGFSFKQPEHDLYAGGSARSNVGKAYYIYQSEYNSDWNSWIRQTPGYRGWKKTTRDYDFGAQKGSEDWAQFGQIADQTGWVYMQCLHCNGRMEHLHRTGGTNSLGKHLDTKTCQRARANAAKSGRNIGDMLKFATSVSNSVIYLYTILRPL